ncbi:MAG: hypothetical protein ACYTEU_14345 [Planctomycetota bacterium]|jgi:tRNA-dihydrouridine synthase
MLQKKFMFRYFPEKYKKNATGGRGDSVFPRGRTVMAEQGQVMLEHFEMVTEARSIVKAVPYFRKFMAGYCKRHPQRKKTLLALMACKTADSVIATIKECYEL